MMAEKGVPITAKGNEDAGTVAMGDHLATDLEGSYRDNPDKPAKESVAQVQDVPEGWPGSGASQ
jgi:hypothetical protein